MAAKLTFTQTIPANPGYSVLSVLRDDNNFPAVIHRDPVVAWALESDSSTPFLITLDGLQTEFQAIERPDGEVDAAIGDWYPSAARCVHDMQNDYAEAHEIDAAMLASWRAAAKAEHGQFQEVQ